MLTERRIGTPKFDSPEEEEEWVKHEMNQRSLEEALEEDSRMEGASEVGTLESRQIDFGPTASSTNDGELVEREVRFTTDEIIELAKAYDLQFSGRAGTVRSDGTGVGSASARTNQVPNSAAATVQDSTKKRKRRKKMKKKAPAVSTLVAKVAKTYH